MRSSSPTGDLLSTGGGDKQASLWSRHSRLLRDSPGLDSAVKAIAFSHPWHGARVRQRQGGAAFNNLRPDDRRIAFEAAHERGGLSDCELAAVASHKGGRSGGGRQPARDGSSRRQLCKPARRHAINPRVLVQPPYIPGKLLDSGAQLDVTNCDGNCALNVAAYRGNSEGRSRC